LSFCCCIHTIKPCIHIVLEGLLVGIKLITHCPVPKNSVELYLHALYEPVVMLIQSHGRPYHCSLILCDVAQCHWVIFYQLFRTACHSHLRLQNGSEESFLPMLEQHISPISSCENVCDEPFLRFWEAYQSHCKGQDGQEE